MADNIDNSSSNGVFVLSSALSGACLACFLATELGYLADLPRLGHTAALTSLLSFCAGILATYLIARYLPIGAKLAGSRRFCAVLLGISIALGTGLSWLWLSAGGAVPGDAMTSPWMAMTFLAGATTCMGMLRNYELATKAAEAGARIDAGSLALPLLGGIALFLTVYWLDATVRTIVFYQLNSLAFLLLLAALQASRNVTYASPVESAPDTVLPGAAGLGAAPPDAAPPLRLNRYTHLVMFAFQLACSYCLGMTIQFWSPLTVGIAACIAAVLCLLYFYLAKRTALALGELGKVALPLCVAMTFTVLSASPVFIAVTLVAALTFFILFEIMNTYWLVKTATNFGLVTARHVASGRLPLAIGTACGLLAAFISQWIALALLQDSGMPSDQFVGQFVGQLTALRLITSGLIAIAVVVAYTLLPFNRGTPVKEGIINSDMAKPGTPDTQATRRAGQDKPFHDFCFSFGQSHGLTSREQEVLFLLSCGYNSETIAEILIVSTSTVRTHVYRIYQKTDIHSQQELIRCLDYGFRAQKNSSPPLCGSSKS